VWLRLADGYLCGQGTVAEISEITGASAAIPELRVNGPIRYEHWMLYRDRKYYLAGKMQPDDVEKLRAAHSNGMWYSPETGLPPQIVETQQRLGFNYPGTNSLRQGIVGSFAEKRYRTVVYWDPNSHDFFAWVLATRGGRHGGEAK
jgi:hypothetical protein